MSELDGPNPARIVRATLEMDADGASPTGAVTCLDGTRLGFSGWAEFAATIERWRGVADHGQERASVGGID